ncbi:hypothetical protein CPC08DRAFT_788854 [Agrocybe pediades]|nr:hypothetical protein CPC08DRAFT_788854 [Agrocybe pediades]
MTGREKNYLFLHLIEVQPMQECETLTIIVPTSYILFVTSTLLLSYIRVCAVWNRSLPILAIFGLLWLSAVAGSFTSIKGDAIIPTTYQRHNSIFDLGKGVRLYIFGETLPAFSKALLQSSQICYSWVFRKAKLGIFTIIPYAIDLTPMNEVESPRTRHVPIFKAMGDHDTQSVGHSSRSSSIRSPGGVYSQQEEADRGRPHGIEDRVRVEVEKVVEKGTQHETLPAIGRESDHIFKGKEESASSLRACEHAARLADCADARRLLADLHQARIWLAPCSLMRSLKLGHVGGQRLECANFAEIMPRQTEYFYKKLEHVNKRGQIVRELQDRVAVSDRGNNYEVLYNSMRFSARMSSQGSHLDINSPFRGSVNFTARTTLFEDTSPRTMVLGFLRHVYQYFQPPDVIGRPEQNSLPTLRPSKPKTKPDYMEESVPIYGIDGQTIEGYRRITGNLRIHWANRGHTPRGGPKVKEII